ncbi:type III secretion HpaP family protein [Mitsuaria sp. CC2]|uniref:type III secretion HpaP family protein n=1 Tax=Mitsuaria sp. CC2 TaxID=3029186 RepID=UPI003B8B6E6C
MSDEEIRRIRRLVVADPQIPPLPLPVDARQVERFHRALGTVRRATSTTDAAPEAPGSAPPPPPESATSPRHEATHASIVAVPSPTRERTDRAERQDRRETGASSRRKESSRHDDALLVDGHRPRLPVAASAGTEAREAGQAQEADAEQAAMLDQTVTAPPMPIPHVAWTPLPEGWERELADTVATLCRSSEPNFHSWTIQVPVDAETLPHTELRLSFSPHQLTLRFSTQSTRSLALISAHQSQLRALLVRALPGDRHIEIDIT